MLGARFDAHAMSDKHMSMHHAYAYPASGGSPDSRVQVAWMPGVACSACPPFPHLFQPVRHFLISYPVPVNRG